MKQSYALVLLAALAGVASAQAPKATLHVGDPAPPLVIAKWAKGEPVKELGHGGVQVVEFWATWCGPCKQRIPHLTELAKKYQGKAAFIGVDSFEHVPDPETCYTKVGKFVDDFGDKMNYHVAIDGVDGTMAKTWMMAAAQPGIPTAFVVDQSGKIAWIGHPMMGLDEVVGKVIDGTFDSKAEAAKQAKAQEEQAAAQAKQAKLFKPIMDARAAKDDKAVVKAIDDLFATNPEMKSRLYTLRFASLAKYDEAGAQKYYGELADTLFKDSAQGLNSLVWTLVMDNSPIKHLDTALAIKIAEKAVKLSNDDPQISDTLARAYFRANRVSDAYDLQKKIVDKISADKNADATTVADMKVRLAMYEKANKPTK